MTTVVLDASALLAYLREEPGAEVVDGLLADARMTSVNLAEVAQRGAASAGDACGTLLAGGWGEGLALEGRACG